MDRRSALLTALALLGLRQVAPPAAAASSEAVSPIFTDVTVEVGLDFRHWNGMSGEYYLPEINGAGGAMVDVDGDGDLDLYLVQGSTLGESRPPEEALPLTDRLLRNELRSGGDGGGELRFVDVTQESGLRAAGYGSGVATGDVDNDGDVDLYLTNFGPNQLWLNRGDGTFVEVAEEAGVDDPRWSAPAVFFDYDRDGWLDLFVGSYVDFTLELHKECRTAAGGRDYCNPSAYEGLSDRLFRNRGDGSFEDVSAASGIAAGVSKALGAVAADLDGDLWPDLYVASDGTPNLMWINEGNGTFADRALFAGSALNARGRAEASMGLDVADVDGDGDLDLFMTHLVAETNTLYLNDGEGLFEDRTSSAGLGVPSLQRTSWGTRFFDYDNDGWLDLLVVSGAVRSIEEQVTRGDPFPFHEPNQLFRNLGDGTFEEVTGAAGAAFAPSEVSRGAAFGDVDNDGDQDVLITNDNGPARLLRNDLGQDRHWLGLRLLGGEPGRDMLGALVVVRRADRPALWRTVRSGGSYGSASDPRVLVGLGDDETPPEVEVRWPDGRRESFPDVEIDRYSTLRRGEGREE